LHSDGANAFNSDVGLLLCLIRDTRLVALYRMATKTQLLGADDETVVKNRVLMQTSVNRGEPPFRLLAKLFFQYAQDLEAGRSQQAAEHLPKLLHEISLLEGGSRKMRAIYKANQREQLTYVEKLSGCQQAIEQAKSDIEARKKELQEARLVRQHNEEYEVLRQQIMEHPPRSETQREIEEVLADIKGTEASSQGYLQLLDLRRKQFALLLHAIDDLQGLADVPLDDDQPADPMQE
jgi:THO complex subunit 7